MILKNPCFTSIPDIETICNDYFTNLDLHFFGHVTVFPDGKFHFLCSEYTWPDYSFVQEEIPPAGFTIHENIRDSIIFPHKDSGADLGWSDEVMRISYERFGITNPMIIYKKYESHFEGFFFDLHSNNPYEKYLNNFDLFVNFIHYYKDKAKKILNYASKNQLKVHEKYLNEKANLNITEKLFQIKEQNKELRPKQYFLSHGGIQYSLSIREYQCLSLASHGKKIKDIGRSLDLSERTVETHLNSLKRKLNVTTLGTAIEIYWKNRILIGGNHSQ